MKLEDMYIGIVPGTYNIGFKNGGREDETQFDVDGKNELKECWETFCEENNISTDCIAYVERVAL